jgi:hypothetical protein
MRTFTLMIMVWLGFSSFISVFPVARTTSPCYARLRTTSPWYEANAHNEDAFAFMYGKWRGKGWYLKNDVKEPFDITQWVKLDKKKHLNMYGFSQKHTSGAQPIDFTKSIVWDSAGQKANINFYFKENFLVITPISSSNGNDWCFQFDDEYGQSYRFTWQTNKENLWIETGEFLSNGEWMTFCKLALEKQ